MMNCGLKRNTFMCEKRKGFEVVYLFLLLTIAGYSLS